ncbi:MAG: MBL fold metallo-hydrolase [Chloroflexi bacterium]|nr:MBL fold metallo-hydrolase [Chloroflexota bacterium]
MEVARGVYQVPRVRGGNVYLIEEESITLVDSGLGGSGKTILEYVRALGRQPEEVTTILLTHGHPDHYGGAADLQQETGARVLCHPGDAPINRKGHRRLHWSWFPSFRSPRVDGLLHEGQELAALGGLRVLHTPGHTVGSLCFLAPSRGLLFTGDTLLSDGEFFSRPSPLPGMNLRTYRASLWRLAELDFQHGLPGHGRPCYQTAAERVRHLARLLYVAKSPAWWRLARNVPGLARFGYRLLADQG